ncbi:Hypothetical predicted protein, partial [Paramuricea clavata]
MDETQLLWAIQMMIVLVMWWIQLTCSPPWGQMLLCQFNHSRDVSKTKDKDEVTGGRSYWRTTFLRFLAEHKDKVPNAQVTRRCSYRTRPSGGQEGSRRTRYLAE